MFLKALFFRASVRLGQEIENTKYAVCTLLIVGYLFEQEVLGRTTRLLSLRRHEPCSKRLVQQFFYCCVYIHYRGNVSTEPLPNNDRGIHRHTHRQQRDLISLLYIFQNKESRLKILPISLCVCMCIPHTVARQRLGKGPPILAR
jgi:hypothetical protein